MPDPSPIHELYRKHGPGVFRRAKQVLGNDADASEILQEVFLSLQENPDQYEGRSQWTTFLYQVTTHACLNRLRNERNRLRLRDEHADELALEHAHNHLTAEQLRLLTHALSSMPEELARVAVYCYHDGLTHEEIANILDCSRRHVGNLLERVQAWTADNLGDDSPDLPEISPC